MNKPTWSNFFSKLKHKYRFVVLQEDTLQEKTSFRLSRMNVIFISTILAVIYFFLIFILVSYTKLKEYIPGYADFQTREIVLQQNFVIDSLEYELIKYDHYTSTLQKVLSGDMEGFTKDSYKNIDTFQSSANLDLYKKSKEDSALRQEIEGSESSNLVATELSPKESFLKNIVFFQPVSGVVTQKFNLANQHYAIDLASSPKASIKAVLDGTVVLANWDINTGYVIAIQHSNNLVSVYKHNSTLLKKIGNFVRAGDAIAIIGETGELSEGPHLHFELWHDGKPIDPELFIVF